MTLINELRYPKEVKSDNLREIYFFLKSHGFKPFGNASNFASVFSHPKLSYILKIFSSKDTCYRHFYEVARKNQWNPHFPQFRGKMMRLNDNYYAVRLERLTPSANLSNIESSVEVLKHRIDRCCSDRGAYLPEDVDEAYPDLADACSMIRRMINGACYIDTHDENIMFRGDTPVIIDPWAPFKP